ncbi:hypothetical protein, partial [uncultured Clostridium sp.]|uniref:hypothetical protein n=2 Tax=uncultured Clostridium sp. TaxID=59620 RepID=UPI002601E672
KLDENLKTNENINKSVEEVIDSKGTTGENIKLDENLKTNENINKSVEESIISNEKYNTENINTINKNINENYDFKNDKSEKTVNHTFDVNINSDSEELNVILDKNVKKVVNETIQDYERKKMLDIGLT